MGIGSRLKEERERLGLSQTDFGGAAKVDRKSQFNYENGKRYPDAAYLSAVAAIGADVLYVLTGNRDHAAGVRIADLAPDEAALLDNYRNSPEAGKAAIKTTSAAFAQSKHVKKKVG